MSRDAAIDPTDANGVEQRILDAARHCFRRYGVHRTRMDDIAELVGLARPNLYRYVAGKDDVISMVINAETEVIDATRRSEIPLRGPVGPIISRSLDLGVELAVKDPYLRELMSYANVRDAARVTSRGEAALPRSGYWYPIFEHGRNRDELRPDLTNQAILHWVTALSFLFVERQEFFSLPGSVAEHADRFVVPALLRPEVQRSGRRAGRR